MKAAARVPGRPKVRNNPEPAEAASGETSSATTAKILAHYTNFITHNNLQRSLQRHTLYVSTYRRCLFHNLQALLERPQRSTISSP